MTPTKWGCLWFSYHMTKQIISFSWLCNTYFVFPDKSGYI